MRMASSGSMVAAPARLPGRSNRVSRQGDGHVHGRRGSYYRGAARSLRRRVARLCADQLGEPAPASRNVGSTPNRRRSSGSTPRLQQRIVQLVGVAHVGPGLVAHRGDRRRVERAQAAATIGQRTRRSDTARARRSSSGASSRNAYGLALRISCENGDGAGGVARPRCGSSPRSIALEHRAQAVEVHRLVQAVVRSSRAPAGGPAARSAPPAMFSWQAACVGEHRGQQVVGPHALDRRRHALAAAVTAAAPARASRSSASAWRTSARPAAACASISRAVAVAPCAKTSSSGKLCCAPSESTMPSSVAAACSSKSKVRQKRLRSASPQARLMRPPKGAWITSCMPPLSSKKRSATRSRCVGRRRARPRLGDVGNDLLGTGPVEAALVLQTRRADSASPSGEAARGRSTHDSPRRARPPPQLADLGRQLGGARRRLAQPERDRRRRALRVHRRARVPTRRGGSARSVLPRRKMSPAMLSTAKSSLTVPTKVPAGSATTS